MIRKKEWASNRFCDCIVLHSYQPTTILSPILSPLRRISCHGRNYSQPYFFKRNQPSDNRSHGFGAKFLLKKLSASDFSYERKSAFRLQLHGAIYRLDSFVLMLRYCANLKAIGYESTSMKRIVADKSRV